MNHDLLATLLGATPLRPIEVALPGGDTMTIPVLRRTEVRAPAEVPKVAACWAPNKPALLFNGHATWAEFILVGLLEAADWDARWVRNWSGGRQFCTEVGEQRRLMGRGAEIFDAIHEAAPELKGAGTWDVIAWNGDELLFLESKQAHTSDHLRPSQLLFLETALRVGVSPDAFAIVEYDAGRPIEGASGARPARTRAAAPRTPSDPNEPGAPRPRRAAPALDPELARLIATAAAADAPDRIGYRDRIAAHGSPAVRAMEDWVSAGRPPAFAIAVLEAIGRQSDPTAAIRALKGLRTTLVGWETVIDPAISRVEAARRTARATRATGAERQDGDGTT
jgi:hypothetical protein